nr:type IV toxin-antitoxin system AbiEi family antitoxin domain-containing protein [Microbispora sp. CL1-1]
MVTTRQAELNGAHRRDLSRLVQAGILEHMAHGVYRLVGAPHPDLVDDADADVDLKQDEEFAERVLQLLPQVGAYRGQVS